jgi:hypothetical protein
MAYTKYSLTPANNNAAPPDGAPEGMLPSAVNDTMRDMMAQIRDCGDGIRGGTYTMTAPVITGGSINGTAIGATTASTGAFSTLSATGVTTVQAGSVSAPAITTTGDTNTGIFFPAADTIAFTEGGTESLRITSSGVLELAQGQIKFPATQVPSADANTLDDYEEGTWTPVITSATGSITSYTVTSATYTKIGRSVTVNLYFTITNNGTGGTRIDINNSLPFATQGNNPFAGAGREGAAAGFMVMVSCAATTMQLWKTDNTYPGGTNFAIWATCTYFV